jgi:transcriptional regulator with XRE-family HTH domain
MEYTYKATYLSNNLKLLIQTKSQRDGRRFSAGQLAEAIGAPRSLISRLISDSAKNTVKNPRIETLYKVARFFYEDGFAIDVNDLLDPNANLSELLQHPKVHISKKLTLALLDINNTYY